MLNAENSIDVNANSIIDNTNNISSDNSELESKDSKIKPNIVIIQLESFINPNWITDITLNKNPVSTFEKLSEEFTSGLLAVPTLGGGTANTEFEVITGMSTKFFGTGEFPFNTLLSSNTCPSIAYYLKNLNYSTHALHNNDATFYSRYKAYKNLGFDTFTPIECMLTPERTPMGWAKDSYLISEVKNLLESTPNPDLAFTVSVQGHGSYPNLPLDNPVITVLSDNEIKNLNSIKYYVNQLHEMDEFIGNLISTVNSLNEPSVIVFYGDHHPAIDVSAEDFTTNSLYTTPYAIWDNINLSKESVNLNAYELSSLIIKKLNLPKTILSSLYSSNIDEETKYKYLHLIEYDSLYGKDYLNYADSLEASSSFNYGINVPIINDVQVDNNITTITGQYFNTFSKVFVNGSAIDSTYINPNTLQFTNYKCKTNDIITVKQMAGAGKIELLSSEDFTFK